MRHVKANAGTWGGNINREGLQHTVPNLWVPVQTFKTPVSATAAQDLKRTVSLPLHPSSHIPLSGSFWKNKTSGESSTSREVLVTLTWVLKSARWILEAELNELFLFIIFDKNKYLQQVERMND